LALGSSSLALAANAAHVPSITLRMTSGASQPAIVALASI